MKKTMTIIFVLCLFVVNVLAQFAGGDGTESNPYQVATAEHLDSIRNYLGQENSSKYFIVNNDINLSSYLANGGAGYNNGAFWEPIGNSSNSFYGNFNGNYKKITGLKINRPGIDNVGLFGILSTNAVIKNIGVENTQIIGHNYVGMISGSSSNAKIEKSYATGNIRGESWVGGLVGLNNGNIEKSYTTGSVYAGYHYAGGITGQNDGTLTNCYSFSAVDCGCYIHGSFMGDHWAGLAGVNNGTINYCYFAGEIVNIGFGMFGALVAMNNGTVNHSYWDREIAGVNNSAGSNNFYGKSTAEMKIKSTYAGWDFTNCWEINADNQNGYPYLTWQTIFPHPFAGGNGTLNAPWQITTAEQLNCLRYYLGPHNRDYHFIMMNDIDLTTYLAEGGAGYLMWGTCGWYPIGNYGALNQFESHLNGNGFKIKGLKINQHTAYPPVGLFGMTKNCVIQNLGIEIDPNDSVSNEIDNAGGIVGLNIGGSITSSYVIGKICGHDVGGIAGNSDGGKITDCYMTGLINARGDAGGLIGACTVNTIVTNSYWDKETTTQLHSAGSVDSYGKTTIEMKTQSTYSAWDFIGETINGTNDYWGINTGINNGYPYLANPYPYTVEIKDPNIHNYSTMINNYPNPFNPSTMIQFSLAKPSMTELKVYNSRGEVVKTLIKGLCSAGNQQVQFDGSSLASGVYYYRLTTPEQSLSGKMMLIK